MALTLTPPSPCYHLLATPGPPPPPVYANVICARPQRLFGAIFGLLSGFLRTKIVSFISFSDPPVRVELDRKWKQFVAGEVYNVSCRVMGSRPPAQTSIYIGSSQLRQINYQVSLTTVTSYHFLLCCTLPLSNRPFMSADVSSSPLDGQLEFG